MTQIVHMGAPMRFKFRGSYRFSLITGLAILVLVPLALFVSAQETLPPIQFNVPYRCTDGTTYIIQRCEMGRKGEVCFYRIEKNGQLETESYNVRSQMTGWMTACPPPPPQPQAAPAGSLGGQTGPAPGQPLTPPYLSELPAPERVIALLKGTTPKATALLQIGAFYQVTEVIRTLAGPRAIRNQLTPDEVRLMQTYSVASLQVSQAIERTLASEQEKAKWRNDAPSEYRFATSDPRFGVEGTQLFTRLLSERLRAQFAAAIGAEQERHRAFVQAQTQNDQPVAQTKSDFVRNDPGTLAARRCVELGGNELGCVGKGFMTGLLGEGLTDFLSGKNSRTGLTMTGNYAGAAGVSLSFSDDGVSLSGCGKLVSDSHPYTVAKNGNGFLIKVQAEPKPLAFNLGPDGQLAGPGVTDLAGQIITGYNNVWMQEYRNGVPEVGGSCQGGRCGYWTQVPVFAPKTERCTIGALRPTGPTLTGGSLVSSLVGVASGESAEQAFGESEKDLPAPGPRMTGQYAGQGGLALDFTAERVVLDCGEAHVARRYTVENAAKQVLVSVNNGAAPFSLALQPNGTLAGSGNVEVSGRVVTGSTGNGIAFAPRTARCAAGVLAPRTGAASAPALSSSPGTVPPASSTAVLSLTAGLPTQPGSPSPLAGITIYLMKESFASILTKCGIRAAPGMNVIQSWGAACNQNAPECAQAINATAPYIINKVKFDVYGNAKFPALPSATYDVFGWTLYNGHHLAWDLQVDLKAGANTIVLDQRNAITLQ